VKYCNTLPSKWEFGNELLNFDVGYVNQQSHVTREWVSQSVSHSFSLHWITVIVTLPAHCAVMIFSVSWWLLCDQVVRISISTSGTKLKFRCLSTEIMDCSRCREVRRCCTRCRLAVCAVGCLPLRSTAASLLRWQMLQTDSLQLTELCSCGCLVYDYRKHTHVLCIYLTCVCACARVIFRYQDGVRNITETYLPYNFVNVC
jgi:hypothetical protein